MIGTNAMVRTVHHFDEITPDVIARDLPGW
jgi:hypothetical protein